MNVDYSVLISEYDVRIEDSPISSQDHEIHVVLAEKSEQANFVGCPGVIANVVERNIVVGRKRFEIIVVTQDDLDIHTELTVWPCRNPTGGRIGRGKRCDRR